MGLLRHQGQANGAPCAPKDKESHLSVGSPARNVKGPCVRAEVCGGVVRLLRGPMLEASGMCACKAQGLRHLRARLHQGASYVSANRIQDRALVAQKPTRPEMRCGHNLKNARRGWCNRATCWPMRMPGGSTEAGVVTSRWRDFKQRGAHDERQGRRPMGSHIAQKLRRSRTASQGAR